MTVNVICSPFEQYTISSTYLSRRLPVVYFCCPIGISSLWSANEGHGNAWSWIVPMWKLGWRFLCSQLPGAHRDRHERISVNAVHAVHCAWQGLTVIGDSSWWKSFKYPHPSIQLDVLCIGYKDRQRCQGHFGLSGCDLRLDQRK